MKPDVDKVFYLASPYSSALPWYNKDNKQYVIEQRHHEIQAIAAALMKEGYILIEPIGSCHYKQQHFGLPAEYEYWKRRDLTFIDRCDGVIVATLPGWEASVGVTDEIKHAKETGKEVWLLSVSKEYKYELG
jgi:hypothetical protein